MGRTIPSFRMALKAEIQSWSAFRRSLGKGNREQLDDLFDQARSNCMAAGNAVRPVVFELFIREIKAVLSVVIPPVLRLQPFIMAHRPIDTKN